MNMLATPSRPALERRLFRGVFLVALATLLLEVTLTRVLSFTIWYHFAYVAISMALLGYGAAGTLLAVRPGIGTKELPATLATCSILAGATTAALLALISLFPLDPMQITFRLREAILFVAYQFAVAVPFFFSGLAISLALRAAAQRVDRLYFWDLVGAGLGASLAVGLMNELTPPGAALVAAAVFAAAAVAFGGPGSKRTVGGGLAAVLVMLAPFGERIPFTPAKSKHLEMLIEHFKTVPVFEEWTALFRTDVVEKRAEGPPFTNRDEWGLSAVAPPKVQRPWGFVTHDGTAGTPMYDLRAGSLDYLDQHILRLPYVITPPHPAVLVIGVGGGRDVITAIRYGASHVTGVELDPVTVGLIRDDPMGIYEGFFRQPAVSLIAGEGRHYVRSTSERFDLIQLTGVDTLSAQSSGAYVLAENYLYTVEAFRDYLGHLTAGGVLSITTGHLDDSNPNAAGRMVSVARKALLESGVDHPENHLAVIRSDALYADVLVKPEPFSVGEVEALASAADQLRFRPLFLPGRPSHPVFTALASATGVERTAVLARLKYTVNAITDNSPFFFRFYRWGHLFEDRISPVHTTALGQIVLLLLLVSLSVLASVFILGPLLVFRRRRIAGAGTRPAGILLYFLALGLGFMFFEISMMQRFVLFLGYPTYSLTVTLSSLLIFLGCGSFLSRRYVGHERMVLPMAVVVVGLLALFYIRVMPSIQAAVLGAPLAVRVAFTIAMLAPLGIVLGLFFPLGIRLAAAVHEDLVPWAWGINGCASVTGTVLAVILAMSYGFERVWVLSVAIYAVGVAALLVSISLPAIGTDRLGATAVTSSRPT